MTINTKKTGKRETVKINSFLLEEIEDFLEDKENKIEYPSVKNFIDKAVLKLLKEVKKK